MADREKRLIELIRNAADPPAEGHQVRKILSSDEFAEREALRSAEQEGAFGAD